MSDSARPAPDARTTTREDRTTRPDGTERVVRTVVVEPVPTPTSRTRAGPTTPGEVAMNEVGVALEEALDVAEGIGKLWKKGRGFWELLKAANPPK